jgi:hypothetical protein
VESVRRFIAGVEAIRFDSIVSVDEIRGAINERMATLRRELIGNNDGE